MVIAFSEPLRSGGPLCAHPAGVAEGAGDMLGGEVLGRGHPPAGREHQASLWDLGPLRGTLGCTWLPCIPCTPRSCQMLYICPPLQGTDLPLYPPAPLSAGGAATALPNIPRWGRPPRKHENYSFHPGPAGFLLPKRERAGRRHARRARGWSTQHPESPPNWKTPNPRVTGTNREAQFHVLTIAPG